MNSNLCFHQASVLHQITHVRQIHITDWDESRPTQLLAWGTEPAANCRIKRKIIANLWLWSYHILIKKKNHTIDKMTKAGIYLCHNDACYAFGLEYAMWIRQIFSNQEEGSLDQPEPNTETHGCPFQCLFHWDRDVSSCKNQHLNYNSSLISPDTRNYLMYMIYTSDKCIIPLIAR